MSHRRIANPARARELGAAYKPGYPSTYTASQTRPVYRTSERGQAKELERLMAASGMTRAESTRVLERKYARPESPTPFKVK